MRKSLLGTTSETKTSLHNPLCAELRHRQDAEFPFKEITSLFWSHNEKQFLGDHLIFWLFYKPTRKVEIQCKQSPSLRLVLPGDTKREEVEESYGSRGG